MWIHVARYSFIILFFLLSNALYSQGLPDSCQLSAERFYLQLAQDPESLVLDVRGIEEDRTLGISGAIAAPELSVLMAIMDTLPEYRTLYVYCSCGDRSEQALQWIRKRYSAYRIFHLKKGFERWQKLQYPIDTLRSP